MKRGETTTGDAPDDEHIANAGEVPLSNNPARLFRGAIAAFGRASHGSQYAPLGEFESCGRIYRE